MSEKKSVAKSIRLTPELYDFINKYGGEGFNDKFNNIISFCFKREKEIMNRVNRQQKELDRINEEIRKKQSILDTLRMLELRIDQAISVANQLPTNTS